MKKQAKRKQQSGKVTCEGCELKRKGAKRYKTDKIYAVPGRLGILNMSMCEKCAEKYNGMLIGTYVYV